MSEGWREGDAYLFAFMSMVDPNDSTYNWGCYGRDIWMYYANYWLNPMSSSYSAATAAVRGDLRPWRTMPGRTPSHFAYWAVEMAFKAATTRRTGGA